MIRDLDRTIEDLLKLELTPLLAEQISVSFAAPDSDFPPQTVVLPAVDLFLYDVRENNELRNTQWIVERNPDGTSTRSRPPVRVDCSYLITAWASETSNTRALEEHHLLSEVMRVLLRHPVLPEVLLQGKLRGQEPSLPATTLQPGRLQSVAEFWQALGGKPKAALNYTVTIGISTGVVSDTEIPVLDTNVKLWPSIEANP